MRSSSLLLLLQPVLLLFPLFLKAQGPGALGSWRDHFTYVNAISVVEGNNAVYCASSTGIFKFDRGSEEIERLTKVNALSDVGINGLAWQAERDLLLVYYSNGNIDLLQGTRSHNMSDIKRSSVIGNKSIYSVFFEGRFAYLSCGFGIVVLDLDRREVRDTWFIGPGGSQVRVNQITMTQDSIYAATQSGLFVASRSAVNLASFDSWRRRDLGAMAQGPFSGIVNFADRLVLNYRGSAAGTDTMLVMEGDHTWWRNESYYGRETRHMRVSNDGTHMVTTHGNVSYVLDYMFNEVNYVFEGNGSPQQALLGRDGLIWVADRNIGLIRSPGGSGGGTVILPNGPKTPSSHRMDMAGGRLFVSTGAVAGNWANTFTKEGVHHYADGDWRTSDPNNTPLLQGINEYGGAVNDILAVAVDPRDPDRAFAGSWEEGLIEFRNREPVAIYGAANSILAPPEGGPPDRVNVAGLDFDRNGDLWITNSHAPRPIAVLTRTGQWHSFDPGSILAGNYLMSDILAASNGYKWIIRPRGQQLLVFNDNGTPGNTSDDQYKLIRTQAGQGGLPSPEVFCVAEDKDGEIWVGTNKGVAVFYNPAAIFSGGDFDAQQILIEQDGNVQILFETEAVSAIAVDGADRKWVGTQTSGVFLVSSDGRTQIHHFTAENSPLPGNSISSIAIDDLTGEVFIGTDQGIISYRSDATGGEDDATCATVFPNPVRQEFGGVISVTGLMRDSEIKITDVAGNLVHRTSSLGGMATWDGNDMGGNRVSSGVYLIFASDRTGTYKCNTKVLVIR
jgi:hypothetical protein